MRILSYPFVWRGTSAKESRLKLALLLFEAVYRMVVTEERTMPVTFTVTVGVEVGHGASHYYADIDGAGERE